MEKDGTMVVEARAGVLWRSVGKRGVAWRSAELPVIRPMHKAR